MTIWVICKSKRKCYIDFKIRLEHHLLEKKILKKLRVSSEAYEVYVEELSALEELRKLYVLSQQKI